MASTWGTGHLKLLPNIMKHIHQLNKQSVVTNVTALKSNVDFGLNQNYITYFITIFAQGLAYWVIKALLMLINIKLLPSIPHFI